MAIVPHDQAPIHTLASPAPPAPPPLAPLSDGPDAPGADHRLRSVLGAPRGRRFSRPGSSQRPESSRPTAPRLGPFEPVNPRPESHQARQERLLRQMPGNPRVAHMLEHGPLPHWMIVARQRQEEAEREARESRAARAADEPSLADLPGMAPSRRRGRHRAPRRRWVALPVAAISVALLTGVTIVETVGRVVVEATGFPI